MNTPRFTQILQDYGPMIRRYLNRKCNNLGDVDDLYQECVCAIFQALPRFAGRSSVSTWVFGICRNVFSNYVYYKKRDLNLRDKLQAHAVNLNSRETPDLRILIDRLPAVLQKLHQLYYVEGLSVKEISIGLDKAEGTIKYLLYRLRNELREMLK